jgi:hypothetical protein
MEVSPLMKSAKTRIKRSRQLGQVVYNVRRLKCTMNYHWVTESAYEDMFRIDGLIRINEGSLPIGFESNE